MKYRRILLLAALIFALAGHGAAFAQAKTLNVVATITSIQDIAQNGAGD